MLAKLSAIGLIATGIAGIAYPEPLARIFGAPLHEGNDSRFVRATSVRDVALGAIMLCACNARERNIMLAASLCGIGISVSDFICTSKPVHLAGVAVFAALAANSRA